MYKNKYMYNFIGTCIYFLVIFSSENVFLIYKIEVNLSVLHGIP